MWEIPLSCELLEGCSVPAHEHLVKKEVKLDLRHFQADQLISSQPSIRLLSNQGVEIPATVWFQQLVECTRITVLLTDEVQLAAHAFKVEDINGETDRSEKLVLLTSDI